MKWITKAALSNQIAALAQQVTNLEAALLKAVNQKGEQIMSAVNTSGANLAAGEAQLETDIAKLGAASTQSFADLKAEVQNELNAAGVPSSVVDSITAKLVAQDALVQGMLATAIAADPGPQTPPAAPAGQ